MARVVLDGLTKRFGDFAALDDVSFKVRQGSFHALLGENGAGKSTLVKCVMGYERPTDGDVLINERGVHFESTREAHAAGIGMVLVITAEPATAAAACLDLLPDRAMARPMASPTASTSTMFFSTTALGGSGSTA